MPRDHGYLLDIKSSGEKIRDFTKGISREEFLSDDLRQDAVIRRIEIIGEAAKLISTEFKETYAQIPWYKMAGMRNRLIHEYNEVDLELVWKVAVEEIPALMDVIQHL